MASTMAARLPVYPATMASGLLQGAFAKLAWVNSPVQGDAARSQSAEPPSRRLGTDEVARESASELLREQRGTALPICLHWSSTHLRDASRPGNVCNRLISSIRRMRFRQWNGPMLLLRLAWIVHEGISGLNFRRKDQ